MIQTETTPNPNSIKFLSEKVISAIGTEEFQKDKSKVNYQFLIRYIFLNLNKQYPF